MKQPTPDLLVNGKTIGKPSVPAQTPTLVNPSVPATQYQAVPPGQMQYTGQPGLAGPKDIRTGVMPGLSNAAPTGIASGVVPSAQVASYPGLGMSGQGLLPGQGLTGQGVLPGQGLQAGQSVATRQGVISGQALVSGQAVLPKQGLIPGQGIVPNQGMLLGQGLIPGQGTLPGQGAVPGHIMMSQDLIKIAVPVQQPGKSPWIPNYFLTADVKMGTNNLTFPWTNLFYQFLWRCTYGLVDGYVSKIAEEIISK